MRSYLSVEENGVLGNKWTGVCSKMIMESKLFRNSNISQSNMEKIQGKLLRIKLEGSYQISALAWLDSFSSVSHRNKCVCIMLMCTWDLSTWISFQSLNKVLNLCTYSSWELWIKSSGTTIYFREKDSTLFMKTCVSFKFTGH